MYSVIVACCLACAIPAQTSYSNYNEKEALKTYLISRATIDLHLNMRNIAILEKRFDGMTELQLRVLANNYCARIQGKEYRENQVYNPPTVIAHYPRWYIPQAQVLPIVIYPRRR